MSGEPVRILEYADNADAVVSRHNNEANEFQKGPVNIYKLFAIISQHAGACPVTVPMGLNIPNEQNPDRPHTVLGHVLNVVHLYAESLMSRPVANLYHRFMEKSSTRIIEKTDKEQFR